MARPPFSNRAASLFFLLSGLLSASLSLSACSLFRPTLHAALVSQVLKPNQVIEINSLWKDAKPLRVTLRPAVGTGPPVTAELRAVYDGTFISFLAIWPDRTPSEERLMWVWDAASHKYYSRETMTDLFAFKFTIKGANKACMMTGEEGVYDVWEWRAGWSHIFGYAEDKTLSITRTQPTSGEFSTIPSRDPRVLIYLQWKDDEGRPPYKKTPRPARLEQPMMFGIKASEPSGSAGDVLAEEVYQNRHHNLEVMRKLKTDHDDDYQMEGKGPHVLSIALTNDAEKEAHYTSDLIYLYLD